MGSPPRRKWPKGPLLVLLALLAGGAAVPHIEATRLPRPPETPSDAILVLTGGENRISEAYRAWKEGKGVHLFILGAGREATLERILPEKTEITPANLPRLHIETWSENTLENAFSARAAVTDHRFGTVILVTSGYHLPRAYLAIRSVLPKGVSISVMPVWPDGKGKSAWWRYPVLYFTEGWKYWGYRLILRGK